MSWPLGKNIDKWIIALLKGLAAVKKFSILIEVSLAKIEKVGGPRPDPGQWPFHQPLVRPCRCGSQCRAPTQVHCVTWLIHCLSLGLRLHHSFDHLFPLIFVPIGLFILPRHLTLLPPILPSVCEPLCVLAPAWVCYFNPLLSRTPPRLGVALSLR